MKTMVFSFPSSHRLALLVLFSLVRMGASFVSPPGRPSAGSVRCAVPPPPRASATDVPSEGRSTIGPKDPADGGPNDTQKLAREAVLKATDAVLDMVEQLPSFEVTAAESLASLGDLVNEWDDQAVDYFAKGFGVKSGHPPSTDHVKVLDGLIPLSSLSGDPPPEDDGSKEKIKVRTDVKAIDSASSAAVKTPITAATESADATSATDVASAAAETTSKKDGSKAMEEEKTKASSPDASSAEASSAVETKPDSEKLKGTAEETVQLDRPKQVQSVFDDFQKKAVEYYNSGPVAKAAEEMLGSKSGPTTDSGATAAAYEKAQKLEARLEALLESTSFRPRKLGKAQKHEMVDLLEALEGIYPESAKPLEDPSLDGQWSLVYSSQSTAIKGLLKGLFSFAFKTSQPRQVVDTAAAVVINACIARLRLTPISVPVAQRGAFEPTSDREVTLTFSSRKQRRLGRFVPTLRSGKSQAEVTYLSHRWRICCVAGVTVAFRKNGE